MENVRQGSRDLQTPHVIVYLVDGCAFSRIIILHFIFGGHFIRNVYWFACNSFNNIKVLFKINIEISAVSSSELKIAENACQNL